jgi:hypothetical protein
MTSAKGFNSKANEDLTNKMISRLTPRFGNPFSGGFLLAGLMFYVVSHYPFEVEYTCAYVFAIAASIPAFG